MTDLLILKQLNEGRIGDSVQELDKRKVARMSMDATEFDTEMGELDEDFFEKGRRYRLHNQLKFQLMADRMQILKNVNAEQKFKFLIGCRDQGLNLAYLGSWGEEYRAFLNSYYSVALAESSKTLHEQSDIILNKNKFDMFCEILKWSRLLYDSSMSVFIFEVTSIVVLLFLCLLSSVVYKQTFMNGSQIIWVSVSHLKILISRAC